MKEHNSVAGIKRAKLEGNYIYNETGKKQRRTRSWVNFQESGPLPKGQCGVH